uniref:Uncharacterized protein n=1 Tax=Oryza barthii TaxID=65489 RepID=A0A0D3HBJ0_9ORYZ
MISGYPSKMEACGMAHVSSTISTTEKASLTFATSPTQRCSSPTTSSCRLSTSASPMPISIMTERLRRHQWLLHSSSITKLMLLLERINSLITNINPLFG